MQTIPLDHPFPATLHLPDGYVKPVLDGGLKWVTALRSGNYAQAVGKLATREDAYCCLGVWCDIKGYPIDVDEQGFKCFRVDGVLQEANPNDGSPLRGGQFPGGVSIYFEEDETYASSFITLNDDQRFTFEQIAAVAELLFDLQ